MKRNIGELDSVIRVILSFVLAYIYYTAQEPSNIQVAGLLVACYLIISATFGNDVFYRVLKCSTVKEDSTQKKCSACNFCQDCEKCTDCGDSCCCK